VTELVDLEHRLEAVLQGPHAILRVDHDRGGLRVIRSQLVDLGINGVGWEHLARVWDAAAGERPLIVACVDINPRGCVSRTARVRSGTPAFA
jgi:hypothetical protein